ncbi:hypothetical protein THMA_0519 [Thermotoga maritima MSB8]|uniref:Uncharacterized protein n=1 Tax=Thermotoga maritima (strain ATCC 43589 / DSM 3109 / JCM 10099 / NBRC 100826 / MSB8) TaxID=243274 RepID=Q9WYX7_THEMA|nr:hypothetical protein TM_0507 [Thermotoga maritima MSB8]AHD17737.1 hypothetical protein THEMA_02140 [Thermotoga maritima MSB8]AKE26428.1 hypothetical protein THMC_0519 [Thermotoga maritima]AKE28293.1 hypothetical protein THMA_0519 [Thermotoga maritima MSB8]AKE30166.1 hypothetical protein THMB_0519 [Thermotoga maritima]
MEIKGALGPLYFFSFCGMMKISIVPFRYGNLLRKRSKNSFELIQYFLRGLKKEGAFAPSFGFIKR